jgi:hypothetical protein
VSFRATCGIWRGSRRLIAVTVDDEGCVVFEGALPAQSQDWPAWFSGLELRHGPGIALVLTERTARHERIGQVAVDVAESVWIAPADVVAQISRAAWFRPTPRQLATVLARLPRVRAYRAALRPASHRASPSQLPLPLFDAK